MRCRAVTVSAIRPPSPTLCVSETARGPPKRPWLDGQRGTRHLTTGRICQNCWLSWFRGGEGSGAARLTSTKSCVLCVSPGKDGQTKAWPGGRAGGRGQTAWVVAARHGAMLPCTGHIGRSRPTSPPPWRPRSRPFVWTMNRRKGLFGRLCARGRRVVEEAVVTPARQKGCPASRSGGLRREVAGPVVVKGPNKSEFSFKF